MNRQTKALLAENNALERGLTAENDKILTDIVVYLRAAAISEYQQELVRRDITHMMLDGQARGASMQQVLGDDYQAFCEQVIAALPPLPRSVRALAAAGELCCYASLLTGIWLVFQLLTNMLTGGGVLLPVTAGDLLGGAAILTAAWLTVFLVCRYSFQEQSRRLKLLVGGTCLVCFACLAVSFLLQYVLFHLHALTALAIVLVLFGLNWLISSRLPS